jgi:glycosyltransferase involved in cell wall biosynthesis
MKIECNASPIEALTVGNAARVGQSVAKRVLVVSYDFPPNRTSAVYRMTGLIGHLPHFGWKPTVLTIPAGKGAQEPKLLEKLPSDVEIVRTRFLRINGWEDATAGAIRKAGALNAQPNHRRPRFDRYLRSLGELVRSTLYFPDDTVGWVPSGLVKAVELLRQERFDAVYTTSPPRSSPVIGLILKKLCGIPWVCELMDPWYPPKRRIRRKCEDWLQQLLLRNADRVVVMVDQHGDELRSTFKVPNEKLIVIRNGFFEEDFAEEPAYQNCLSPEYFHLSHFGTIYPENYGEFFPALRELLNERPELRQRLRLNLIGYPCEAVLRLVQDSDFKDVVQVHGFIPERADTLRMMRASNCLLLFWGRPDFSRLAIAGKTYDYLRVGRPILALTEEGGVKELVEQARAGLAASAKDTHAIKQALMKMLSSPCNGYPHPARPEFVDQFRWDRLSRKLAEALCGAAADA